MSGRATFQLQGERATLIRHTAVVGGRRPVHRGVVSDDARFVGKSVH